MTYYLVFTGIFKVFERNYTGILVDATVCKIVANPSNIYLSWIEIFSK